MGIQGSGLRVRSRKQHERTGFTLIELAVSMSILLIGIVSVVSATSRMHGLRKHNRERIIAFNGLRSMAERLSAQSFRLSREDPETWSTELLAIYGPGGTQGDVFDVRGLNVDRGEENVGRILFVTNETWTDADVGAQAAMPRDLNGDGDENDPDVSADARVLPVVLSLQWYGQSGSQTLDHVIYLTQY